MLVSCFHLRRGVVIDLWDNLSKLFNNFDLEKQEIPTCVNCGEEISSNNTCTPSGQAEYQISGVCEKCFDYVTFNLEENLYELDESILNLLGDGVVLAGGALRKLVDSMEVIADYDLFFVGDDANKTLVLADLESRLKSIGYTLVFRCPKGELTTFKKDNEPKVQIVNKRNYTTMDDLISSFDITACCAAYNGDQIITNSRFVFDNLNKKININRVEYPNATLRRILKYAAKGFKLSNQGSKDFILAVNGMDITPENDVFYID